MQYAMCYFSISYRLRNNYEIAYYKNCCCSQDDQQGPLKIQLKVNDDLVFDDLVKNIIEINFLQYSSSDHMVGIVGNRKLVEVFLRDRSVILHTEKKALVKNLITRNVLDFYFLDIEKAQKIVNTLNQNHKSKSIFSRLIFWK